MLRFYHHNFRKGRDINVKSLLDFDGPLEGEFSILFDFYTLFKC